MTESPQKFPQNANYEEIMENVPATNVAGWTEPNFDRPCSEKEYRERLKKNGPLFQQKLKEVFHFE